MAEFSESTRARQSWAVSMSGLTGSVYGTVLASALVLALGRRESSAVVIIGVLLVTELVFALAHAWSALLATGTSRSGLLPTPRDVRTALLYEWPVLQATWPAIVALLLAASGIYSVDTGVNVALAANTAVLVLWGFGLARVQGASALVAVAAGVVTGGFGVLLVLLKLWVK